MATCTSCHAVTVLIYRSGGTFNDIAFAQNGINFACFKSTSACYKLIKHLSTQNGNIPNNNDIVIARI